MNWIGFYTLFQKEVMRFSKVWLQTIGAPILTALLYQLIFAHAVGNHIEALPNIPYHSFLIPGLAMMSMAQNAFANTSSSLIQSRITGNIVFILLPPLSSLTIFAAYVAAAMVRSLTVGFGVILATAWFGLPFPQHPWFILPIILSGSLMMASLGMIAGIWAEKFDQLAAFQNFIIVPLTFLSGVFYSIHKLPSFWQSISYFNPIFYLIDGLRYAFFGQSDVSPWLSGSIVTLFATILSLIALYLLHIGWKLRNN